MPPGRPRVATKPVPTGSPDREDDRDDRSRLLHRDGIVACGRDDDVDPLPDELGCDFGDTLGSSFRPAMLDRDGAFLDPTKNT